MIPRDGGMLPRFHREPPRQRPAQCLLWPTLRTQVGPTREVRGVYIAAIAGSRLMEDYGTWIAQFSHCRLDDRRPAGNLALDQCGEWLLTSLRLARNVAADVE